MTKDIRKEKLEVQISNNTAEDCTASSMGAIGLFDSPYEIDNTAPLSMGNLNSVGVNTTQIDTNGGSLQISTGDAVYNCGSSSSNYGGILSTPYYNPSSTTITIGSPDTYKVFTLPRSELPQEVYACGRLLTLGLIGTDVECAYIGDDKLLFEPGLLNALMIHQRLTLSVKYFDATFHYNLTDDGSKAIEGELVSTISHKKKRVRRKK